MTSRRVLVIQPDGTASIRQVADWPLEPLRALLGGGWVETINGDAFGGWSAYLDEKGELEEGLDANWVAIMFAVRLGWYEYAGGYLAGPVVFLGPPDSEGDDTDLPDGIADLARELLVMVDEGPLSVAGNRANVGRARRAAT